MARHNWELVTNWKTLKNVVKWCKQTGYASIDYETTGTPFYDSTSFPTIVGICFQPGYTYIIPLGHFESCFRDNWEEILQYIIKEIYQDETITKIAWNAKFEHKWTFKYRGDFKGRFFDGMLAKYLLDEEQPFSLESQVQRFLPHFDGYKDDTKQLAKKHGWAKIPLKTLSERCALDCDLTFRLFIRFEQKLISGKFYNLFRNLISPLSRALAECEFMGVPVNASYLDELIKVYAKKIADNETSLRSHSTLRRFEKHIKVKRIQELIDSLQDEIDLGNLTDKAIDTREKKISTYIAGNFVTKKERKLVEPFNFGSPKQLCELFFTHKKGFNFPILAYTLKNKRPTKTPSTGEKVLLQLKKLDDSGFIQALLNSRELEKLNSTYIVGIKGLLSEKNRIHTSYLIHGTATGRLSSREPNMQNVPRVTTNKDIKPMFIPPDGCLILEVDYSQAELRIAAELANETTMIRWFNEKKNIHVASACRAEGLEHDYDRIKKVVDAADEMTIDQLNVSPEHLKWVKLKKRAKTINFGIMYEQGDAKLAETIGCTKEEAAKYKAQWFKDFPKIARFFKKQHAAVMRDGYVLNQFGFKRRLPGAFSSDYGEKLQAQRQAVNTPTQGGASHFTLFSIVLIRDEILRGNLPPMQLAYTVHDSIGYFIKPEHIHIAAPIVTKICANPSTLKYFGFEMKKVNMKVSIEVGRNWGQLVDYKKDADYIS